MKFFKTRIGTILLTALICAAIFGGAALAATFPKSLSGTGNVITANPDLGFFSDAACTTPLTIIAIPDVVQGETAILNAFYLKNTGNKQFTNVVYSTDLNASIGTLTSSQNNFVLSKGQVVTVSLTLTTIPTSPPGPFNFNVTFSGTY